MAWLTALTSRNGAASSAAAPLPRSPLMLSHSIAMPSAGTSRASIPRSRAEPDDLEAAPLQHASHRQRREDVPAGAARHDHCDLARHRRRTSRGATPARPDERVSWWMRSSTPSQPSVTSRLLRP